MIEALRTATAFSARQRDQPDVDPTSPRARPCSGSPATPPCCETVPRVPGSWRSSRPDSIPAFQNNC